MDNLIEYQDFLKGYKVPNAGGAGLWIGGNFKRNQNSITIAILRPGDVCIDVGANIGFYTLMMSKAVGRSGLVYAFEPVPETFNYLQQVVQTTHSTNIETFQMAMSNKVGVGKLIYNGIGDLCACVAGEGYYAPNLNRAPQGQVNLTTLDVFVKKRKFSRLDFIKTDCQGADLQVLEAGKKTINEFRPKIICEAINLDRIQSTHNFFESINYYSVCVESGDTAGVITEHIMGVPNSNKVFL
ncbi:MAG: FkbM family methyltransferase [Proteobacteria bacterium]|jgi:FkbM family methyltransferase|nr:FkbM family methyltransferase [Pseudomonadota bacterium]